MKIVSVTPNSKYREQAIRYFQEKWSSEEHMDRLYEDAIVHSYPNQLPQWYVMIDDLEDRIIGCVGLITNDFISRMDLWPWLCALYIDEAHRGKGYGQQLIQWIFNDVKTLGYRAVYLCTDHIGYYEKSGFEYIGDGYHPWGETSRVYKRTISL